MSRKIWLVLAIAALVAVSFAASVVAARKATENRVKYVTRGLDYLHARQGDTGGFGNPENTAWAVLGAVASGERMGNSAWHVKGKNPYDYLQSTDLVAASTGIDVTNAPVYYSRLIMAYVAMDRAGTIGTAGSKGVNLLNLLLTYQNTTDGSPTKGAFAPSLPSVDAAVRTTSWAILAMHNAGVSHSDARYQMAEAWLADQQNDVAGGSGDGGFPSSELGGTSDALDTALAYQALSITDPGGTDWYPSAALDFLKSSQKSSGGFSTTPGGATDAEATSAAIQMIVASGGNPDGTDWRVGIETPVTALHHLLEPNGSYKSTPNSHLRPVTVTSWVLVALNHKPFTTYPKNPGSAHKPFKFRPQFKSVSPEERRQVQDHAHRPHPGDVHRLLSQGHRHQAVGRASVRGQQEQEPAGRHRQVRTAPAAQERAERRPHLQDRASGPGRERQGDRAQVRRRRAHAGPDPHADDTTHDAADVYTARVSDEHRDDQAVRPADDHADAVPDGDAVPLRSPSPAASPIVTGSPVPSPSTSASPAGAGGSGGGGSAAGFVGGTLLAMLPIGAVISYLLLHRREGLLGTASQGAVLAGGGSTWQRFKQNLARSKDLTRPSSRE